MASFPIPPPLITDQNFVCPLCLCDYDFDESARLACGHTYCKRCLHQRMDGNMLNCPECQRTMDLGDMGLDSLQSGHNYLIRNILAVVNSPDDVRNPPPEQTWPPLPDRDLPPTVICRSCEERQEASRFCTSCEEYLCSKCVQAHQRVTLTKDHRTVPADTAPGKLQRDNDESTRFCHAHDQVLGFCCDTCTEAICPKCMMTVHLGHRIVRLEEAVQETQAMVPTLVSDIKVKGENVEKLIAEVDNMNERVDLKAQMAANEVRTAKIQFIKAIEEKQQELLQQIDTVRLQKESILNGQREQLTELKNILGDAASLVLNAYNMKHHSDLIGLKRRLLSNINHIHNQLRELSQPHDDESITFTPRELPLKNAISQMGVISSNPSALHTTASGHGINSAIVGQRSRFTVLCRDHMYAKRGQGAEQLEVRIRSPDSQNVSVELIGQHEGSYQFIYCPTVLGAHQISITMRGKHIHGSPMIANVRHRRNYFGVGTVHHQIGVDGEGDGQLCRPWGICCDTKGNIIVADRSNNRIQVFNEEGIFSHRFGETGNRPGLFDRPAGVAVNSLAHIVVADKDNHRIQVFTFEGKFLRLFGERGTLNGQLHYPWDVAVNNEDCILVSDTRNHRIQLFSPTGQYLNKYSFQGHHHQRMQLPQPRGVCFTDTGDMLVTDFNKHRLMLIPSNFQSVQLIGSEGSGNGQFFRPQGVSVDLEGNIFVTEGRNNRVQIFRRDGTFLSKFGTQGAAVNQFDKPSGICVSPDGYIVVVDFGNNRIQFY